MRQLRRQIWKERQDRIAKVRTEREATRQGEKGKTFGEVLWITVLNFHVNRYKTLDHSVYLVRYLQGWKMARTNHLADHELWTDLRKECQVTLTAAIVFDIENR